MQPRLPLQCLGCYIKSSIFIPSLRSFETSITLDLRARWQAYSPHFHPMILIITVTIDVAN